MLLKAAHTSRLVIALLTLSISETLSSTPSYDSPPRAPLLTPSSSAAVNLESLGRPSPRDIGVPSSLSEGRQPLCVAPSILAGDFGALGLEVQRCAAAGCFWLHVDICDGVYVPGSLTLGPQAVAALARAADSAVGGVETTSATTFATKSGNTLENPSGAPTTARRCSTAGRLQLDCHVAVMQPSAWVEPLAKAGCTRFTFQWESLSRTRSERTGLALELACRVRSAGMACGVCLAKATPAIEVRRLLRSGLFDLIDVLAVEPGFGGQAFDPAVLAKVKELSRDHPNLQWIAIDGGVNAATAGACAAAGANMLIAGTAVFGAGEGFVSVCNDLVDGAHESPLSSSSARLRAAVAHLEALGTSSQQRRERSV